MFFGFFKKWDLVEKIDNPIFQNFEEFDEANIFFNRWYKF